MVDLDEYREASHASWDRIATNWDSEREWIYSCTGEVSRRMVERLDPQPGDTILDLAAGTGDTGYMTLDRIGANGKLISTDFAESMVDAARGNAEGLDNVEHRVLDAEKMDLEDSSIDGVLCRFGYMLMADPAAALAETRRVLKEGKRVAFAVWGSPEDNQWAFVPGFALVSRGHLPPPEPGTPGIFALGDPERIREVVTGAGFSEPQIEQVDVRWTYGGDAAAHWDFTLKLAGPLADALQELDDEEVEEIRAEVATKIEAEMDSEGAVAGRVHVVTAS